MSRLMAGWIAASVVVLATTAVQAQTWAYPDDPVVIRRGPYGALPPGPVRGGYIDDEAYDDAVPAREVVKMVRSLGFKPQGPAVRRRGVYTVSAVNRQGEEGRVVVDALTGRMMRFVPATTASNAEPNGAPVVTAPQQPKDSAKDSAKADARASRPPAPQVATRTPPNQSPTPPAPVQPAEAPVATATTTTPAAPTAAAAPPAQPKTVEAKALDAKTADAKPADTRSVQAKPSVQLLPTQAMPPVQGLE